MLPVAMKTIVLSLVVVLVPATASRPARAEFPEKAIKIVVPYQPGGGNDIVARLLGPKLTEIFKQPIIVENKPGAGGMIAVASVAKASPDGYTMLIDAPGVAMNPSLYRKVLYDPKALQPVAQVISYPQVIVVNPKVPVKNIKELIEFAKSRPGQINVATAGSSSQLSAELFRLLANINFTFIPYKGSAPATASVVSGDTDVMFSDIPSVAQHVISGRVRLIAVSGDKRSPMMPDAPTVTEAGMPEYVIVFWYGMFVPAGTPAEIVTKLNAALNRAVMQPDVVVRLTALGVEPVNNSVEAFSRFFSSELARWKDVVTRAKLPLNDE